MQILLYLSLNTAIFRNPVKGDSYSVANWHIHFDVQSSSEWS